MDEALRDSFFRNNAQLHQDIQELEEKVIHETAIQARGQKLGKGWISPLLENILLQSQESFDYYSEQNEKNSASFKRSV